MLGYKISNWLTVASNDIIKGSELSFIIRAPEELETRLNEAYVEAGGRSKYRSRNAFVNDVLTRALAGQTPPVMVPQMGYPMAAKEAAEAESCMADSGKPSAKQKAASRETERTKTLSEKEPIADPVSAYATRLDKTQIGKRLDGGKKASRGK